MQQYISYTADQANMIIDLFRHKLVHLAQPKSCISYNNKVIARQYVHYHTPNTVYYRKPDLKIQIKPDWTITLDQIFTIRIMQLKHDIQDPI